MKLCSTLFSLKSFPQLHFTTLETISLVWRVLVRFTLAWETFLVTLDVLTVVPFIYFLSRLRDCHFSLPSPLSSSSVIVITFTIRRTIQKSQFVHRGCKPLVISSISWICCTQHYCIQTYCNFSFFLILYFRSSIVLLCQAVFQVLNSPCNL